MPSDLKEFGLLPAPYWYEAVNYSADVQCVACDRRACFLWVFCGASTCAAGRAVCRGCMYRPQGYIYVQDVLRTQ